MARPSLQRELSIFQNSRLVGQLRRRATGALELRYHSQWLGDSRAVPVSLSLPLREDPYTGDRVVAFLDNLLPDSPVTRRKIAVHFQASGHDSFSLLAAIGRDCVGALQFLPAEIIPDPAKPLAGTSVSDEEIAAILADLPTRPFGLDMEQGFRISLAGTQEKTALLKHDGQWCIPLGTTPTTHIIKPSIGLLPNGIDLSRSVENEFLALKLTAAFGLPCATAEIAEFAGRRALVVKRFDRVWGDDGRLLRVPQEDLCQALGAPPTLKYEADGGPGVLQIMTLLRGADAPAADRRLFFAALVVYWLLAATDGHAKNFSIFLRPGGRFRLAPLYDVVSAQPNADAGQIRRNELKLAMALGERRHYAVHTIARRHFLQTAATCGLDAPTANGVLDDVLSRVEPAIAQVTSDLPSGFPADLADQILGGLRARAHAA